MADTLLKELYRWHRARPFRRVDAGGRRLVASATSSIASARSEIARYGYSYARGLMDARLQDEMEGRANG